jgi:hypothetical protein
MERLDGTVVSYHKSSNPHLGGYFGEIQTPTGHLYIWSSRNVYQNGSLLALGIPVTFEPVAYCFAQHVDSIHKNAAFRDPAVEISGESGAK